MTMPTYEYECDECGKRFELFQQMTDDPVAECPDCGGGVRRLIGTGGGLILKGEGFHANDYSQKKSCPAGGCCSDCPVED
jgi:putative FmdB family regulatory protein